MLRMLINVKLNQWVSPVEVLELTHLTWHIESLFTNKLTIHNLYISVTWYPSIEQATEASMLLKSSSHTVPQVFLWNTSSLPDKLIDVWVPFTKRMGMAGPRK